MGKPCEMKRLILTGERNRGKTSFCRLLAAEARNRGLTTAGILSLKEMTDEEPKALWASDTAEKKKRELARYIPEAERSTSERKDSKTPSWDFFSEGFLWGNAMIRRSAPADLFILDEAGPLEFTADTRLPREDRSWTAGMERMDADIDRIGLVVIRPELVDRARLRWPDALVLKAPDWRSAHTETERIVNDLLGEQSKLQPKEP